ncbi:MAG: hypothetical protein KDK34_09440 [Leptospiraceae bacterium]|nr:hypothetical protein [Leptospiraceae bacterium]
MGAIACAPEPENTAGGTCVQCHPVQNGAQIHPGGTGCVVCHKGNATAVEQDAAHQDMIAFPGNLSNATNTCGTCHAEQVERITKSLMTTNAAMIRINRAVFGEDPNTAREHAHALMHTERASDSYFAQLCASCHLGQERQVVVDRNTTAADYESNRYQHKGGGCLACHVEYTDNADDHHAVIRTRHTLDTCVNCHSRSARIGLNYQGLSEQTQPDTTQEAVTFADGRTLYRMPADVHHAAGMVCTDCHTNQGIMGDGRMHAHKSMAVKIACTDCHRQNDQALITNERDALLAYLQSLSSSDWSALAEQSARPHPTETEISVPLPVPEKLTSRAPGVGSLYLHRVRRSGEYLSHVIQSDQGDSFLRRRSGPNDAWLPIPALRKHFGHGVEHSRLDCQSCHSQWAPDCMGCHISYDPTAPAFNHATGAVEIGLWIEAYSEFFADAPALGVLDNRVRPVVQGMKLEIDTSGFHSRSSAGVGAKQKPGNNSNVMGPTNGKQTEDNQATGESTIWRNLFAPIAPHTTGPSRSCRSCHLSSQALGFGRGEMRWESNHWVFYNRYAGTDRGPYGTLAADGWIEPFRSYPTVLQFSTRPGLRPFSPREQRTILAVGNCLRCHDPDRQMEQLHIYEDFERSKVYTHQQAPPQ